MSAQGQPNRRRSERVVLRVTVVVKAENEERKPIEERAETQVVNAHGGLLRMREHLHVGQAFRLNNPGNNLEASCKVVRTEDEGMEFYKVAFEFDRSATDFWPVKFSPTDWGASRVK
jgi:hypothetical protein